MHNNLKAFEFAKEIVVAKMSNATLTVNQTSGEHVANFFEAIFNKLVDLEETARESKND